MIYITYLKRFAPYYFKSTAAREEKCMVHSQIPNNHRRYRLIDQHWCHSSRCSAAFKAPNRLIDGIRHLTLGGMSSECGAWFGGIWMMTTMIYLVCSLRVRVDRQSIMRSHWTSLWWCCHKPPRSSMTSGATTYATCRCTNNNNSQILRHIWLCLLWPTRDKRHQKLWLDNAEYHVRWHLKLLQVSLWDFHSAVWSGRNWDRCLV